MKKQMKTIKLVRGSPAKLQDRSIQPMNEGNGNRGSGSYSCMASKCSACAFYVFEGLPCQIRAVGLPGYKAILMDSVRRCQAEVSNELSVDDKNDARSERPRDFGRPGWD